MAVLLRNLRRGNLKAAVTMTKEIGLDRGSFSSVMCSDLPSGPSSSNFLTFYCGRELDAYADREPAAFSRLPDSTFLMPYRAFADPSQ